MTLNPVLLTLWAVLSACFIALLIYRSQLSRYEDEKLYLNEGEARQQESHRSIVRRINTIQPVVRIIGGAASLVTLCAVGIYVWNAWQSIQ